MTDATPDTPIEIMSPPGYRVITPEEAEERFEVTLDVDYPFQEFADEQEIRLYEGGLHVSGTLTAENDDDWVPYNIIVDGDLTIDGDLDWWDHANGNFVLVTGSLRARNVLLTGCPTVAVRGDLLVDNGIQGSYGDDGGFLSVDGRTQAKIIVSTLYFNMTFGSQPDAIVAADPHRTSCPVDFSDGDLDGVVLPELLGDDSSRISERKITQALRDGRPVLRPGVLPSHLAALAELDAMLAHAADVTEIDLASRKLRAFPEQLFGFPNLRVLSLAGNDRIGRIPKRIAELTALEELNLSGMGLRKLPKALGRLANLRVLNIGENRLQALPDRLGELANLRVLRARRLTCPLPDSLAGLTALEELDLSSWEPAKEHRAAAGGFPMVVTRLPSLRVLDLSMAVLREVPDALLELRNLEELDLTSALGRVPSLPDLSRLPRLRVLRVPGSARHTNYYPDQALLAKVWTISTLEELDVDRWGKERGRRPMKELPDDVFSAMPGLRRVDLSFNPLTTLPESFYQLANLEFVDLQYTKLDEATLDRIRATFPTVRMDLRHVKTRNDVNDPAWQRVHELVKSGARVLTSDRPQAVSLLEEALALCVAGTRFSDYDHLYALYGLVDALGHLYLTADEQAQRDIQARLIRYSRRALGLVPRVIWHFTDEGAFQEEVARRAGNALAWHLMLRGELDEALSTVDYALGYADSAEFDYIRDTKVRILLKLGRADDAYRIVDQVLTRAPDFGDFADLKADPDFQQWRLAHSTAAVAG